MNTEEDQQQCRGDSKFQGDMVYGTPRTRMVTADPHGPRGHVLVSVWGSVLAYHSFQPLPRTRQTYRVSKYLSL